MAHPEVDPAVISVKGCMKVFEPVCLQTTLQQHVGRNYVLPTIEFSSWRSDCDTEASCSRTMQTPQHDQESQASPKDVWLHVQSMLIPTMDFSMSIFWALMFSYRAWIFCALRKQSPAYIRSREKIAFLPGWVTPIKKREEKKIHKVRNVSPSSLHKAGKYQVLIQTCSHL